MPVVLQAPFVIYNELPRDSCNALLGSLLQSLLVSIDREIQTMSESVTGRLMLR